jgi:hypothetical protein
LIRLMYVGLATVMTFTPLAIVWASDRGPASQAGVARTYGRHYNDYHSHYYYYGGGHGGWLGNSYGWGQGSYGYDRTGGVGGWRSGGPGAGGK